MHLFGTRTNARTGGIMDIELFEALGKVAGLAGLVIGLVLWIVREILKKGKKLTSDQTYKVINAILILVGVVAVIGLGLWGYSNHQITARTITGHVMEAETKNSISGAEVIVGGRNEATQTDGAGNFKLSFLNDDLPKGQVHVFVSKVGYTEKDKDADLGQYVELTLTASAPPSKPAATAATQPPVQYVVDDKPETYLSDNTASGACADYGAWGSVCTPAKPEGWTIAYQSFDIQGDPTRKCGGGWTHCEPKEPITATRACYRFQTQGQSQECGHSGNTGIHYSTGVLTVLWKHSVPPAPAPAAH
jgi:hypothetical protein